jgi:hypothetical protein
MCINAATAAVAQVGNAFEPGNVSHRFTPEEKIRMAKFETLDYFEPETRVFKVHMFVFFVFFCRLRCQCVLTLSCFPCLVNGEQSHIEASPEPGELPRWIAFAVIGILVGLGVFFLKQTNDVLFHSRSVIVDHFVGQGSYATGWILGLLHSTLLAAIASALV